ncbi:MAG: hypothetical protein QHC40_00905 [Sphingobium sp.]|nr:hypothetical protein [Sphingobium sp.]
MQEFFADYGLWLLIALLVVIGLIVLLTGRKPSADEPVAAPTPETAAEAAAPPATVVAADPVEAAPPSTPIEALSPTADLVPGFVAAAPEPAPALAPEPAPIPVSPSVTALPSDAGQDGDDLLRLKGVGPKLKTLLASLGVTSFAQIAAWTDADIAGIDAQLGSFKGRPIRDQWVDQARYLASGDVAGFEAKYGKL